MDGGAGDAAAVQPETTQVDLLVAGLGPGGCAAALAAHREGLSTVAVEARGPEAGRYRLVLVRPGAQEALRRIGLPDITQGRRASTIRHVEESLRAALAQAARAEGPSAAPLSLHWHMRVVALEPGPDAVTVTLRDEASGHTRIVRARHVIDATGGRLEAQGRPARGTIGPRHLVATGVYDTEPWFDGIAGIRDPATREALIIVPMRGRGSMTAYLDARPGDTTDPARLVQRFEAAAQRLAMGAPRDPILAVDVVQRLLKRPSDDRVVPIGDSVGTVDLWIGAGMSTAIEDALEAAGAIAAAQRAARGAEEMALTAAVNRRILARHRSRMRSGRLMQASRPVIMRLWPAVPLEAVRREAVGCPKVLWPAMRLVAGRRPQNAG
jgi:2-polyprenyl-6-methoxyphenol hydroxylase-like FAD-dependent oxidoreductase